MGSCGCCKRDGMNDNNMSKEIKCVDLVSNDDYGVTGYAANVSTRNHQESISDDMVFNHVSSTLRSSKEEINEIIRKKGRYVYPSVILEEANRVLKEPTTLENKATYYGFWNIEEGTQDGKGIMMWPDGSYYEGYWKDNQRAYHGRHIYASGDMYEGGWLDDKENGYGIYYCGDGGMYEGEWRDGKRSGKGVETWSDGSRYDGQYAEGMKQGYGKFSWGDNSQYEGQFFQNDIQGKGTYIWPDGRKYSGEWQKNMMPYGKFDWPDGRRYIGEYLADKKHGRGVYSWF